MKTTLFVISIFLALLVASNTQSLGGFDQEYKPPVDSSNGTAASNLSSPDVSFNFLDSPLVDIVWCGEKKNVLFILTEKNSVYRSVDDGFSGHSLSSHLQQLGQREITTSNAEVNSFPKTY